MLCSTIPRPKGRQATRRESAGSPFLENFDHASSQITAKKYQTWSAPKEKPKRFCSVGEPRPLPSTKQRYIEGIPVLPLEPPPKSAGHPKSFPRSPICPRPTSPARSSLRLQYADGLPVLHKTATEIAAASAAALQRQPLVYFRDHTRGRCIHCALTASPCTFTKATPSKPCGRCRRLGLVCMIRRPGTARQIVTGDEAGDWVPVQRAVEEAVGEDGARALAERAMQKSEEDGTRTVFGGLFRAKDVRGWCLPKVVGGGEGGDGFWRRVLRQKEEREDKGTEGVNGSSIPKTIVKREGVNGCLHTLKE